MFYALILIFVFYNTVLFAGFRGGIYSHLRWLGKSKTFINKHRKGIKNYWFYASIHKNAKIDSLYYLNTVYLLYSLLFSITAIVFGYIKALQPFFWVAASVLCLIELPAVAMASVYNNRLEFGRAFVFAARTRINNKPGRLCSSLIDICSWIFSAVLVFLIYTKM